MDKRVAVAVAVLGWASPAFAFHLGDHAQITKTAFAEARACLPQMQGLFSEFQEDLVLDGDLDEDLNLARKLTKYSHYYNPYKKLAMSRADGSVTVKQSEQSLVSDPKVDREELGYVLLGRVIHHIQDVAVPPHVVPVSHSFWDGFERYSVTLPPENDCSWVAQAQAAPDRSLMTIYQDTAVGTYARLDDPVSYIMSGVRGEGTWGLLFWTPGQGSAFGSYGKFGNHFGDAQFTAQGQSVSVDPSVYERFKESQMDLAVSGTRRALLWFVRQTGAGSL